MNILEKQMTKSRFQGYREAIKHVEMWRDKIKNEIDQEATGAFMSIMIPLVQEMKAILEQSQVNFQNRNKMDKIGMQNENIKALNKTKKKQKRRNN